MIALKAVAKSVFARAWTSCLGVIGATVLVGCGALIGIGDAEVASEGPVTSSSSGEPSGDEPRPRVDGGPASSTTTSSSGLVVVSMRSKHEGGMGPPPGGKIVCLDCHKAGGAASEFSFGGQSVAGATIKLSDLPAVGCDADGYFWLKGTPLQAGSKAAVGKGDKAKVMSGSLTGVPGGSCDAATCHGNPGVLRIDPD